MQKIAPIYFASFVLITQFVLLNVVVAVMMKHLEESKFEETKSIKSPRTPRLFLGKRSPDTRRRSKNSPRFSKRSQQSLKSESVILKNKGSLRIDVPSRRARSLDEIRNNNLSQSSGSDCFDDVVLGKVPGSLRQRKPSLDNDNFYEMPMIKKQETFEKSRNPIPVLEVVDVGDSDTSDQFANTSELFVKPSTFFVCPSEPVVQTSEPVAKISNPFLKSSEPFVPGTKSGMNDEQSTKSVVKNGESESGNRIKQSKEDMVKTDILEEKNEKATEEVQKEDGAVRNRDNTLPMENKKKNENNQMKCEEKERLNTEQIKEKNAKLEQKEKEVERKMKEMDKLNEGKESKEKAKNENMKDDLKKRKNEGDVRKSKDEPFETDEKNAEEKENLNVEDNLNSTMNKEENSRQTRGQAAFVQPQRNDEQIERDTNIASKCHEGTAPRGHEETLGSNKGSQAKLMDNNNQTKHFNKGHFGVDKDPEVNLTDSETNTLHKEHMGTSDERKANLMDSLSQKEGSQVNLVDNSDQKEDLHDVGVDDGTKQGLNKRTQFHGNRLEPLPVTKLPPPGSNA